MVNVLTMKFNASPTTPSHCWLLPSHNATAEAGIVATVSCMCQYERRLQQPVPTTRGVGRHHAQDQSHTQHPGPAKRKPIVLVPSKNLIKDKKEWGGADLPRGEGRSSCPRSVSHLPPSATRKECQHPTERNSASFIPAKTLKHENERGGADLPGERRSSSTLIIPKLFLMLIYLPNLWQRNTRLNRRYGVPIHISKLNEWPRMRDLFSPLG
jgi:hypothetical protein